MLTGLLTSGLRLRHILTTYIGCRKHQTRNNIMISKTTEVKTILLLLFFQIIDLSYIYIYCYR